LQASCSDNVHKVTHIKWRDWPDRVSPNSPLPIVHLLTRMRPLSEKGPIVVHCSAGIGRTGTYCALDYATDKITAASPLSIPKVVKEIRNQRLHSVQSMLQYLYLHVCLLEYLIITKATNRTPQTRKFQRDYEKYLKKFNQRTAK
uniref:Receptor-type tyrosine-protein phosphatase epsilon n=1 Tax=Toxocara canis TaxID=6265 RepID=A0A183U666_TOXCA